MVTRVRGSVSQDFQSREDMKAYDAPVGSVLCLNEGGRSGEFVVKEGTPPSDPKEGIYIVLANGNYAERIYSGSVNVKWFGAKGDGVADDLSSIQAAIDLRQSPVFTPKGAYNLNGGTIILRYSTIFEGASERNPLDGGSKLQQNGNAPAVKFDTDGNKATIKNFTIEGNGAGTLQDGLLFPSTGSGSTLSNLWILNMGGNGIHAAGESDFGIDLVSVTSVKCELCKGYGVKLDLSTATENGFNNSLFSLIECSKNELGGYWINQASNNVFLKCHSFQNSNPALVPCHGFYLGPSSAANKLDTCWPESDGEVDNIDPSHKSCGFLIDGGTANIIENPNITFSAIGVRVTSGADNVIRGGRYNTSDWASSADIIIESGSSNVMVENIALTDAPVIANFSDTATIITNNELPASGRIPYQASMRRGVRGKAFCYKQGSVNDFGFTTPLSATAGDDFATWNTVANLKTGDNIIIPGAGSGGSSLTAQIIDVDFAEKRYILDSTIETSVTNASAASRLASVFSEDYGSGAPTDGSWQVGDRVWYIFPNANPWPGFICTASGTPGTFKRMADLVTI